MFGCYILNSVPRSLNKIIKSVFLFPHHAIGHCLIFVTNFEDVRNNFILKCMRNCYHCYCIVIKLAKCPELFWGQQKHCKACEWICMFTDTCINVCIYSYNEWEGNKFPHGPYGVGGSQNPAWSEVGGFKICKSASTPYLYVKIKV